MEFYYAQLILCIRYMIYTQLVNFSYFFFFQAEDGIRDCLLSRGLGDVYKRQDYRGIIGSLEENKVAGPG